MLLRRKLVVLIGSTALVITLLAYLANLWIVERYIERNLNQQQQVLISTIMEDIAMFDKLLSFVEAAWQQELAETLPELAVMIDGGGRSDAQLAALKQRYNLSDIHIINADLTVVQSTSPAEVGLDLTVFSDSYTRYISALLNRGLFAVHRVSPSTETGRLKKYAYFSPVDSNIIVNVDLDVKERLLQSENSQLASYLFGDYVQQLTRKYPLINDIDLYISSNADSWSLWNEGKSGRMLTAVTAVTDSASSLYTVPVNMQSYDELGFTTTLAVEFDNSLLSEAKKSLSVFALFITPMVIALCFWLFHVAIKKTVIERLMHLVAQLNAKREGDGAQIHVDGDDELSALGRAINKMMGRLESEKVRNTQLTIDSNTDVLTCIPNRRAFSQQLALEWKRAQRHKGKFSLLMIDVDYFKKFNDQHGHSCGDECLRRVALVIKNTLSRPEDFLARYGGEEFVCLLPETDEKGCIQLAQKIRQTVEEIDLVVQGKSINEPISVSIGGITVIARASVTTQQVVDQADAMLYRAKREGRNRVVHSSAL